MGTPSHLVVLDGDTRHAVRLDDLEPELFPAEVANSVLPSRCTVRRLRCGTEIVILLKSRTDPFPIRTWGGMTGWATER